MSVGWLCDDTRTMFGNLSKLSPEHLEELEAQVQEQSEASDKKRAWAAAQPLVAALGQPDAALKLLGLLRQGCFGRERGRDLAAALFDIHGEDAGVLAGLGHAFEELHDVSHLNAAPPQANVMKQIVARLESRAAQAREAGEAELEHQLCDSLGTAARVMGRGYDEVAEPALLRCVELKGSWHDHYGLGLFYKSRGRFQEGFAANVKAAELGGADRQPVIWNRAICATGAGLGAEALEAWKPLKLELELGLFGLPEGGFPASKVRLAERPLAERDAEHNDPGQEETIWIQHLSPCHGIVRSALFHDIGVDYGDVVLIDGAPVTFHTYGGDKVPVFPHLKTLKRRNYTSLPFWGTQEAAGQLGDLTDALPEDAVVYVHTEHSQTEHTIVTGKVCAPPGVEAADLLSALDAAVKASGAVMLLAPELCRLAGDEERAALEERRAALLQAD